MSFTREVLKFCKNRAELERAEFIEVDSGDIIGHTLDISSVVERVELFWWEYDFGYSDDDIS